MFAINPSLEKNNLSFVSQAGVIYLVLINILLLKIVFLDCSQSTILFYVSRLGPYFTILVSYGGHNMSLRRVPDILRVEG